VCTVEYQLFLYFLLFVSLQSYEHDSVLFIDRYKEYLEAKEQKTEMLKAVDNKLSECERYNKAHEVVSHIRTIITHASGI